MTGRNNSNVFRSAEDGRWYYFYNGKLRGPFPSWHSAEYSRSVMMEEEDEQPK